MLRKMRSRVDEAYSRQSIDIVQILFMLNVGESIEALHRIVKYKARVLVNGRGLDMGK